MRRIIFYFFCLVSSCLLCSFGDILPPCYSIDRYKDMIEHCPFAVKEPQPMDEIEIKGFATLPDGDLVILGPVVDYEEIQIPEGWYYWKLVGWRIYLRNNEPQQGFALDRIEWDDEGCAIIYISKDNKAFFLCP